MYFAVKKGRTKGIWRIQKNYLEQIRDYSGAESNTFRTIEEARAYLADLKFPKMDGYNFYCHEQFSKIYKNELYAVFSLLDDCGWRLYTEQCKVTEFVDSKSVAGNVFAVLNSLSFAQRFHLNPVHIHCNFLSIENWATGKWVRKSPIAVFFYDKIEEIRQSGLCFDFINDKRMN